MGLDIYLYRYEDFAATRAREEEYETKSEQNWEAVGKKYEEMSDAEKEETRRINEKLAKRLNLDKWGSAEEPELVDAGDAWPDNPDHICNTGYLRSSYNEGGFNYVAEAALGLDGFYHIFGKDRDDNYYFQPDWQVSRDRALVMAEQLKGALDLYATFLAPNAFQDAAALRAQCSSPHKALEIFRAEAQRWAERFAKEEKPFIGGNYSNLNGDFFFEKPLEIVAAVAGIGTLNQPGLYVIGKRDKRGIEHYTQSALIAAAMCDLVLNSGEADKYWLHWSG